MPRGLLTSGLPPWALSAVHPAQLLLFPQHQPRAPSFENGPFPAARQEQGAGPGLPAAPAEPLESSQRASLTHRARGSALNAGIGAVMSCAAWPGRLMGAKFFPR